MKTTIIRFSLRRGMLFCCLALGSLLLTNCSTKDLEYIDPYKFVHDEFDKIPNLPVIQDEDYAITEPETGSVENSAETISIVNDVLNAGSTGSISEATRTKLQNVENFSAGLPASFTETAQSLTMADVGNILDLDQELPADLQAVRAALDNMPAEIAALLPRLNLTPDLQEIINSSAAEATTGTFKPGNFDFQAQNVTGPCADAAYDAYDVVMADLTAQLEANMFIIESNYSRRMDEAELRYAERVQLQAERYEATKADISNLLEDILTAADEAESIGESQLATQLRQLTLLYAIDARATLEEWDSLVQELLVVRMAQEEALAQERRDVLTAQAEADFAAVEDQAQDVLNDALNDCHNQGSGN